MMSYYTTEPGYPDKKGAQNADEYYGDGWSVKAFEGKFILTYISGALQGEFKTIEISEDDFVAVKNGKMQLNDFSIKYPDIW